MARNFAIAGWAEHLVTLGGGRIRVAQGVLGVAPDEPGELDRAKEFFEQQTRVYPAGSREYTNALTAMMALENLIAQRCRTVEVVVPTEQELRLAICLQDRGEREWRASLGMRARRLDAGEAVSVAICVCRNEMFGCDDEDARIAYRALSGRECVTTLDLVQLAVQRGVLQEREARAGYERLRREYRFFGPAWR